MLIAPVVFRDSNDVDLLAVELDIGRVRDVMETVAEFVDPADPGVFDSTRGENAVEDVLRLAPPWRAPDIERESMQAVGAGQTAGGT